jgi:putative serine/threonine protein kinase
LEDLSNLSLGRLICYPDAAVDELERRIGELRSLDVSGIILGGRSLVDGLPILGKGCTSTVVKAVAHGRFYALKARRTDSNRASMDSEAQLQIAANSISVGARLIGHTRNFILMELLEGWFVSEWLHGNPPMGELKAVLTRILYDCFKMDSAGLDHGELTDASKHIIIIREVVSEGGAAFKPVIIDFESASLKRRSRNVTSICQFLFLSDGGVKAPSIGGVNREGLIEALKAYKARPSRETFNSILYSTGLMVGQ